MYVADSFGTCSEFWLNIWEHYEFRLAEKKVSETIKALPTIEPDYALRWSVRGSRASVSRSASRLDTSEHGAWRR